MTYINNAILSSITIKVFSFIFLFTCYSFGQQEICVVTPVMSVQEQNLAGEIAHVSISPLNPYIISFESIERGIFHYLWWMDIRTDKINQITPILLDDGYRGTHADRDMDWNPVRFGEKYWFVFVSTGDDGNDNLYLGNTSDNLYVQLTKSRHTDHRPRWSPDGKSIVYVSGKTGNGDLYLITDIDKIISRYERWHSEVKEQLRRGFTYTNKIYDHSDSEDRHIRLTGSPSPDSNPDWSPDGRFIVYQSLVTEGDTGTIGLFIIDLERTGMRPTNILTPRFYDALYPRWSHDQKHIAYYLSPISENHTEETHQLAYLMLQFDSGRITSHSQVEIVDRNTRGTRMGPSWGPGSRSLVFVQNDGMASRIIGRQTQTQNPRSAILIDNIDGVVNREVYTFISPQHKRIAMIKFEEQDYRIYVGRILGGMFERRESDRYITTPDIVKRKTFALNLGMTLLERQEFRELEEAEYTGNNIEFGQSVLLELNISLGNLAIFPLNFSLGVMAGNIYHNTTDVITFPNIFRDTLKIESDVARKLPFLEIFGGYRFNIIPTLYLTAFGGIGQIFPQSINERNKNGENDNETFVSYGLTVSYEINQYMTLASTAINRTLRDSKGEYFGLRFGLYFRLF